MSTEEILQEMLREIKEIKDQTEKIPEMSLEIRDIKLTLENTVNKNITLVAEGHLDLYRKLEEAQRRNADQEMMAIRLNVLEGEVRRLKEKLEN